MRGAMRAHVEAEKGLMFKDATRTMKRELLAVVISKTWRPAWYQAWACFSGSTRWGLLRGHTSCCAHHAASIWRFPVLPLRSAA